MKGWKTILYAVGTFLTGLITYITGTDLWGLIPEGGNATEIVLMINGVLVFILRMITSTPAKLGELLKG